MKQDCDSPWKTIIARHFRAFVQFFMPWAYELIDWSRDPEHLETEFQKLHRRLGSGRKRVDKLIKVWLLGEQVDSALIHVEVQGRPENDIDERMFLYVTRIYDFFRQPIESIVILTDSPSSGNTGQFQVGKWQSRMGITYPTICLRDYADRQAELEQSSNPFALVVLAQLKAGMTRDDMLARARAKRHLVRLALRNIYARQEIADLMNFLDWVLELPTNLNNNFWADVAAWPEVRNMEYIPFFAREAAAQAYQEGLAKGEAKIHALKQKIAETEQGALFEKRATQEQNLCYLLEARFGPLSTNLDKRIKNAYLWELDYWFRKAVNANTLDVVFPD